MTDQEDINAAFADALSGIATRRSDLSEEPLVLELESDPILPSELRIYTDDVRHSGRKDHEFNIEPDMEDYFEESRDSSYSEGSVSLVAGYDPEREVFVLWDLDLYDSIGQWSTLYVNRNTLEDAREGVVERQARKLRQTRNGETVLAARPDRLRDAIEYRIRRLRARDLIDAAMPDDWADSHEKQRQVEDTVLAFLTETPEDDSTAERRAAAQETAAKRYDRDLPEVRENTEEGLWGDSPPEHASAAEAFESALENIESEWFTPSGDGGSDKTTTDTDSADTADSPDSDSADPRDGVFGEWTAPDSGFESTATAPTPDDLYFPPSDDEPPVTHQIHDALRSGKHVVLTGPPGSGKTELAEVVCDHYVGDDYELATATDDWTTFDTIGGYRQQRDDGRLEFEPGVFLRRFLDPGLRKADSDPEPENEWLVIDELNRADIDKAFGSLFSALTGNNVTLPFDTEHGPVTLHGDPDDDAPLTDHDYYVPDDWRLLATMNTDDKSSLYRLSYAFMRRFAFISVPVPTDADDISPELVGEYLSRWDPDLPDEDALDADGDGLETRLREDLADIWSAVQAVRPVGPALVEDVLNHVVQSVETRGDVEYGPAVAAHVLPQLDGVRGDEIDDLLGEMESVEGFDRASAERFAEDFLDADLSDE